MVQRHSSPKKVRPPMAEISLAGGDGGNSSPAPEFPVECNRKSLLWISGRPAAQVSYFVYLSSNKYMYYL
jgi:hypothetical protein